MNDKLEKYRKMHSDIKRLYKECEIEIDKLKKENKTFSSGHSYC